MGLCQLCWLWQVKSSEFRVKNDLLSRHQPPVTRYGITLRCLAGCGVDHDAGEGGLVEYAEDSTGERGALSLDSRPWTLDASSHQWLGARAHEKE